MTLIRPFSDIHLEFMDYTIPPMEFDPKTYLVLAGDIGLLKGAQNVELFKNFLENTSKQFLVVIIILGNHEFYNGAIIPTIVTMKKICSNYKNIFFLNNESIEFDDTIFIGSTLWTSCDNGSMIADYYWKDISDSSLIRCGPPKHPHNSKFLVRDQLAEHKKSKSFIHKEITKLKHKNKKIVVVTHHGISTKSIAPQYINNIYNMFFVEDLTTFFMDLAPDVIIHGHVHNAFDYYLDNGYIMSKTRVVVNPRGYIGHEEEPQYRGFNEYKIIKI